jgi:Double-GTPase 2
MSAIDVLVGAFATVATAALSAFLTWMLAARRMPASHRVAILGSPQSGKTTLITAIFDFLFRYGARGGSVVPRGDETIRRLNANLRQLELKRPIVPTTDQEVFAYRAEVVARSGSFRRRYKLEIGDFPGEDTIAFAEQYGEWLHETPYFQWAMTADAFVFVADVSSVLLDDSGEQVARQKSAFRAAWQRLREHHLDGPSSLSGKSLLLVFTKADLLFFTSAALGDIRDLATGSKSPDRQSVNPNFVDEASQQVRDRFSDLIDYFHRESTRFGIIFTSVFAVVNDEWLGIPELARRVLPRPSLFPFLIPSGRESSRRVVPRRN